MELASNTYQSIGLVAINLIVLIVAYNFKNSKLLHIGLMLLTLVIFFFWLRLPYQTNFEVAGYGVVVLLTLFNIHRLTTRVYPRSYIAEQSRRSFIEIGLFLLGFLSLLSLVDVWGNNFIIVLYTSVTALMVTVIFFKIVSFLFTEKMNNPAHASSSTLPTVTLAIPARNEDAILESVLHQHLTSTYPKLEIIVVDDCSHDKTAEIIKSFAHRGVRFIQGKSTAESWLGKNYAYQELLKSASGELILFCGADIKFSQNTISELVERYLKSNIKMLAVLPKYEPTASDNRFWDVAMQATRYFWQLGLTGLLSSTPPVVGSCWLVEREALMEIGGFKSFRQAIEPERQITKQLAGSRYLFLPANSFESEVVSTKRSDQQKNHILRVAYPLLKRSPMLVGLTAIATVAFLAIPFASFISLFFYEQVDTVWLISAGSGLLLILTYSLIYWYISPRYLLSVVLMLPFMLIQFPVALINSMISYEFSEVEWKGRNICLPPINLQLKRPIKKRGRRRRFRN